MKWVINANSNACRIYSYSEKPKGLILLKNISHPEIKLKTSEILTDRPGHYHARETARGAYSSDTDAKDVEIDNFAREIAHELDAGRNNHAFDKLIIISTPHMNGVLFQHINKNIKDLVINRINKDLYHLADHELLDFLQTNTKYPDE